MTYATQNDMVARFGEREVIALTDREDLGIIDAAVLQSALADADAEIDPYLLAALYTLPLTKVPSILSGFACDITRYRLCGAGVTETDEVRHRYKDAVQFLEKVSSAKISLGLDAASAAPAQSAPVQVSAPERVFTRETLKGY
ncbi:MAG: DUF1320 domain-containing protein [Gallionella sp.]